MTYNLLSGVGFQMSAYDQILDDKKREEIEDLIFQGNKHPRPGCIMSAVKDHAILMNVLRQTSAAVFPHPIHRNSLSEALTAQRLNEALVAILDQSLVTLRFIHADLVAASREHHETREAEVRVLSSILTKSFWQLNHVEELSADQCRLLVHLINSRVSDTVPKEASPDDDCSAAEGAQDSETDSGDELQESDLNLDSTVDTVKRKDGQCCTKADLLALRFSKLVQTPANQPATMLILGLPKRRAHGSRNIATLIPGVTSIPSHRTAHHQSKREPRHRLNKLASWR
jgi:hypothetical protein